ncbi:MAG: hypothetical protein SVN78_10875, partial [Deferribacterota bacterium]|nr:hypothetical protein [Deferribacterota bacterium]
RYDRQISKTYKDLQKIENSLTRQIQREELKATPGVINKVRLAHDQRVANKADRKMDRAELEYLKDTQETLRDINKYNNQAERRSIETYKPYTKATNVSNNVDYTG